MGNIGNELSLIFPVPVQLFRHIIQAVGKIADFILRGNRDLISQISIGKFRGAPDDLLQRFMHITLIDQKKKKYHQIYGKEKKLNDKKNLSAFLIQIAHPIVNGNVSLGSHIIGNRSKNTEVCILKYSRKNLPHGNNCFPQSEGSKPFSSIG